MDAQLIQAGLSKVEKGRARAKKAYEGMTEEQKADRRAKQAEAARKKRAAKAEATKAEATKVEPKPSVGAGAGPAPAPILSRTPIESEKQRREDALAAANPEKSPPKPKGHLERILADLRERGWKTERGLANTNPTPPGPGRTFGKTMGGYYVDYAHNAPEVVAAEKEMLLLVMPDGQTAWEMPDEDFVSKRKFKFNRAYYPKDTYAFGHGDRWLEVSPKERVEYEYDGRIYTTPSTMPEHNHFTLKWAPEPGDDEYTTYLFTILADPPVKRTEPPRKEEEDLTTQMRSLHISAPSPPPPPRVRNVEEEARIAKAMEEVAAKLGWGQRLQLTALEAEYPHLVVPTLATLPPPPKPKPEPESSVKNALKLTSVHKKHLKKIAKELNLPEPDTALFKRFVTYANAMTESRWGHKPLDEHIRDFFSA